MAASLLVERLFARATRGRAFDAVTGTEVYRFAKSPFTVWCEHHAPREARDPVTPYEEMLFREGREHEARVVRDRFPDATQMAAATEEEAFRQVLDAMAQGAPAIHGAPLLLLDEGMRGTADLLVRDDGAPSVFGPWHYVVKEVKLARNLGDAHRLQAAFYHRIVSTLQGYAPPAFHVIDRDGNERTFAYDEAELAAALHAIRAIRDGLAIDPVLGDALSPWSSYCDRLAIERQDVSLVSGVGPTTRDKLVAAGFRRLEDVARASDEALRAVKGVGPARARQFATSARAILAGRHERLAPCAFPEGRTEVFFDLEGTSEQATDEGWTSMDYLIGAVVEGRYHSFVAHGLDKEAEMFHAFLAWFQTLPDPILYHWHHYERTHLRELARRHGAPLDVEAEVVPRMRDLHADAARSFAFPTYGTSIKRVAPYVGFEWRDKDVNGMESIALYMQYARDPAANADKLEKVLRYNEDDCHATRAVKEWMAREGR